MMPEEIASALQKLGAGASHEVTVRIGPYGVTLTTRAWPPVTINLTTVIEQMIDARLGSAKPRVGERAVFPETR
jgi:hypothetical protein